MAERSRIQEDAQTYLVPERGKPFELSGALNDKVRAWIIEARFVSQWSTG